MQGALTRGIGIDTNDFKLWRENRPEKESGGSGDKDFPAEGTRVDDAIVIGDGGELFGKRKGRARIQIMYV